MTDSFWPRDYTNMDPATLRAESTDGWSQELRCFVACPSEPAAYFDDLFNLIQQTFKTAISGSGYSPVCHRAVDIVSSGTIHTEIWKSLRTADVVVVDVTNENGNVLFELGLAAAWHGKAQVILLKEDKLAAGKDADRWLLDIQPFRHLIYTRTVSGFQKLMRELKQVFLDATGAVPFGDSTQGPLSLPTSVRLVDQDTDRLVTSAFAHRRWIPGEGIEFGSLTNFTHSWASVAGLRETNLRVKVDLAFRKFGKPEKDQPWLGLMVRGQSFWANHGHLAYVRADGTVWVTLENEGKHEDKRIGSLSPEEVRGYMPVDVSIDEQSWNVRFGSVRWSLPVADLPFCFGEGRVFFESYFAWVGIRNLVISSA